MRLEGTSEAAALCTTKTSTHPMTIVEEILGSPQARLVTPWRWPVGSDAPERRHPPLAVTRVPPTQSTVAEKLGRDMDDIDDIAANRCQRMRLHETIALGGLVGGSMHHRYKS